MTNDNKTLAVADSFQVVSRYDGMTAEELEDLRDQMDDLDPASGISCRKIKIPSGGGSAFEVQLEDENETEPMKTITGVVAFTHRLGGYWPNAYGSSSNPEDKLPYCASMDGKTGVIQSGERAGEISSCENCPWNQYGTAKDQAGNPARGKACKNMRRLYILMDGDPNLYLLTVPPTSLRDVNNQLAKLAPYADKVITLSLEKTTNSGGTPYSKVVIKKAGVLPAGPAAAVRDLRRQLKEQYQSFAVTLDDYAGVTRGKPVDVTPDNAETAAMDGDGALPF